MILYFLDILLGGFGQLCLILVSFISNYILSTNKNGLHYELLQPVKLTEPMNITTKLCGLLSLIHRFEG